MIFEVPGWTIEQYRLLMQILGFCLMAIVLVYIALSSRNTSE